MFHSKSKPMIILVVISIITITTTNNNNEIHSVHNSNNDNNEVCGQHRAGQRGAHAPGGDLGHAVPVRDVPRQHERARLPARLRRAILHDTM